MKASADIVENIKSWEPFKNTIFIDQLEESSIGYGNLLKSSERNKFLNKSITYKEGNNLLKTDIKNTEKIITTLLNNLIFTLNQNQYDALISLIFHLGNNKIKNSQLMEYIRIGKVKLVSKEFIKLCDIKNGIPLLDHYKRRYFETLIFKGSNDDTAYNIALSIKEPPIFFR